MVQHDFVPAWLNFLTPQSAKSPTVTFEKHGEHLPQGNGRFGVSHCRLIPLMAFSTMDLLSDRRFLAPALPVPPWILWTLVSLREHMLES